MPVDAKRVLFRPQFTEAGHQCQCGAVYAVPAEVRDPRATAEALANTGGDSRFVGGEAVKKQSTVWLARKLDTQTAARDTKPARYWPGAPPKILSPW